MNRRFLELIQPVSFKSTQIILEQLNKYVCIIFSDDGRKATGFFCKILYQHERPIPTLITLIMS